MKNLLQKLKIYFIRLFAALKGKEIKPVVIEKKIYGQKRKDLGDFDLEHIKKLMSMTEICQADENAVQEGFIENRKAYNRYKEWYWKLVGFNKPPEELKKLIDADLKMDRIQMDRLYIDLLDSPNKNDVKKIVISDNFRNALKNGKEITPELENELHRSIDKVITKKPSKDLKKILQQNKEELEKIINIK